MRSLVVDDSAIIRLLLKRMCSPYGESDSAADGEEAFALFTRGFEENNPYDLICLDIQMPKADGVAVLKRIRAKERELGITKRATVLVITSMDDKETVRDVIVAGADDYLLKPIDQRMLAERLGGLGLVREDGHAASGS